MRLALAGVLLARLALAQDLPEVTHLRDGGYLVPEQAWRAMDDEMKRLQWQVKNPPKAEPVPVQGYLIGMAVTGTVGLIVGAVLGVYLGKKL